MAPDRRRILRTATDIDNAVALRLVTRNYLGGQHARGSRLVHLTHLRQTSALSDDQIIRKMHEERFVLDHWPCTQYCMT